MVGFKNFQSFSVPTFSEPKSFYCFIVSPDIVTRVQGRPSE